MKHFSTFLDTEYMHFLIEDEVTPGYENLIGWFSRLQASEEWFEGYCYDTAVECVKYGTKALQDPELSPLFRAEIEQRLYTIGHVLNFAREWVQARFVHLDWTQTLTWVDTPYGDIEFAETFFEDRPEDASDDFATFELPASVDEDDITKLFR